MATSSSADGDGNGTIIAADYEVWRGNFGQSTIGSSTIFASNLIPEPTGAAQIAVAFIVAPFLARRGRPA